MARNFKNEKKDDRNLYELVEGRIKIIQQGIKTLYMGSDDMTGDLIHGIGKNIYFLKDILFDLLIDKKSSRDILDFPPAYLAMDLPQEVEEVIGRNR
jgi:hypothetical protein